ncbi:MAG TPA: methionyl-tRNA formyltransferase [Desulfobacterales bacterium]|nr:methionyl-tRNA formyltransferase [Desulfobacterales bacterium]
MKKPLNIIFMGTPAFAVPPLEALAAAGHRVLAVVTQPDRPVGRGRQLTPPPVKRSAQRLGIPVLQPEKIRTEGFTGEMAALAPDVLVVVAFGRILPAALLDLPRLGAVNIHGSLLPRYRGPAPIQWALINGDAVTGVTAMLMDKGLDTGPTLCAREMAILPEDTSATLHDRLAVAGAEVLIAALEGLASGSLTPVAQDDRQATYAPLLAKKDGRIAWQKSARELTCFIRGMTPWPGAYTFHGGRRLKIFRAQPLALATDETPGRVLAGFEDELRVATGDGVLSILEIQGESGKRLAIRDFLRGHPLPPGTLLA